MNKKFSKAIFKGTAFGIALSVFLVACSKEPADDLNIKENLMQSVDASANQDGAGLKFVPNELLVKFKSGLSATGRENALSRISGKVKEKVLTKTMQRNGDKEGFLIVSTPLAALEARLKFTDSEVVFAEPNYIYEHDVVSNDTYYPNNSLWGMYGDATSPANQYGSQAGEAWALNHTGSSSIHIGVIDEGAMFNHEDLVDNFWTNPFDPLDGIDNDGNGYIDDIHGWDFDGNNNSVFDGSTDDHGTHVAGTIGAKGGNGKGVAGVVWNVKLISTKFLGRRGGTTANAVKAVDYLTDLKVRHGLNLPATNNSWGGGGYSQALKDAIDRAGAQNILFVAAAGNDGANNDVTISYPSAYNSANVIAVASIVKDGTISSFSNYGAQNVDLGAPGSAITSTLPASSKGSIVSSYGSYSGTSMATPHVTGAVALYASSNPSASAAQIKNAILSTTVPTASLNGKCVTGGRLNVESF
ncbi:MAG: S8 family peptidase [Daejeonella sp.]|uniref:S8 family peptidase n=1 Tax=Daejeonella sp. TaxID=2805397 RepID=UPI003C713B5A